MGRREHRWAGIPVGGALGIWAWLALLLAAGCTADCPPGAHGDSIHCHAVTEPDAGAVRDEDHDGVDVSRDCDDRDPAVGQSASRPCTAGCGDGTESCTDGIWGACACGDCTNGELDGHESDVDCGGGTCPACADGLMCMVGTDCASGVCAPDGTCVPAACADHLRNGSETDVDCGGPGCSPCADGLVCMVATDCVSGVCTGGTCQAAACDDMVMNGAETDVDCGGGTCPACADGLMCMVGTDCASGVCTGGTCVPAPSCADLDCTSQHRVCDDSGAFAVCGACVFGYRAEAGGSCVPRVDTSCVRPPSGAGVGLCQVAPGAVPSCHSYVGAVGFDYAGVDFGSPIRYAHVALLRGGRQVPGSRQITGLGDGTLYSASFAAVPTAQANRISAIDGTVTGFSTLPSVHGVLLLFGGRILVGGLGPSQVFDYSLGPLGTLPGQSIFPTQLSSGEIVMSPYAGVVGVTPPVRRYCNDGSAAGMITNPAFGWGSVVVERGTGGFATFSHGDTWAGGTIPANLVFYDAHFVQQPFLVVPPGMSASVGGSVTHPDMFGTHTAIQLPNGMFLVASPWNNKLVRLGPDGSYVDSTVLGTGCSVSTSACEYAPSGLMLDARGRLLITTASDVVRMASFGCRPGFRQLGDGTCVVM